MTSSRITTVGRCAVVALMIAGSRSGAGTPPAPEPTPATVEQRFIRSGSVTLTFDAGLLDRQGWDIIGYKSVPGETTSTSRSSYTFRLDMGGDAWVASPNTDGKSSIHGPIQSRGAILIDVPRSRVALGNFVLEPADDGQWRLVSTLGRTSRDALAFPLEQVTTEISPDATTLRLTAFVALTDRSSDLLGVPELSGAVLGTIELNVGLQGRAAPLVGKSSRSTNMARDAAPTVTGDQTRFGVDPSATGFGIGPDVMVGDIPSVRRYARIGDITAYSIATTSCNVGDQWITWFANTNQHPVIAQNMYRLKDSRFEQIGMSWVKHGFVASNGTLCSDVAVCAFDPTGAHLGVDCSDTYTASLNGFQGNLGPRYQVNPTTGAFPFPFGAPPVTQAIDRRLQVHDADLDPELNAGALYFVEAQYITPDDAAAGNQDNNASYRRVNVVEGTPSTFDVSTIFGEPTARERPAILAWRDYDTDVSIEYVDVAGDGRFIVASKVTNPAENSWHYEYALQNLNSFRGGRSFSVDVPTGVALTNIGFHDVDAHSGSPFSSADWVATHNGGPITWDQDPTDESPAINALRWGMLYNFRFDADMPPQQGTGTLGFFIDGDPPTVSFSIPVPSGPPVLVGSDPPHGAIDARQPFDPNDGSILFGWQEVLLTFDTDLPDLTQDDIVVSMVPDDMPAPNVVSVSPVVGGQLVTLDGPIATSHWTCVSVTGTTGQTCLGYLPADANGDGLSATGDILALVDAVNEVPGRILPEYATDIDRSSEIAGNDILRLIDLLNGAGVFDTWITRTLPPLPASNVSR